MKIETKYSLKGLNTFGMDVKARRYVAFSSTEELKEALRQRGDDDLLILGGGSNVLFTQDVKGLVLHNQIKGIEIESETDDDIVLQVGAGEVWHEVVLYCIAHNYGGVENMSLIPGTVGAAPIQNIGAYGVEQKDVFVKLEALEIDTGELRTFATEECYFGYRDSYFKKFGKGRYVICKVYYQLTKRHHQLNISYGAIEEVLKNKEIETPTIKDISDAVIEIRRSKLPDPKEIGNAGSFFKNPVVMRSQLDNIKESYPDVKWFDIDEETVKVPAGWLIETAGWKGLVFNENYGVHKMQSLVLVNYGGARGKDIKELAFNIIRDIEQKFGIRLEPEVNIL